MKDSSTLTQLRFGQKIYISGRCIIMTKRKGDFDIGIAMTYFLCLSSFNLLIQFYPLGFPQTRSNDEPNFPTIPATPASPLNENLHPSVIFIVQSFANL